jgi:hypothetical protein
VDRGDSCGLCTEDIERIAVPDVNAPIGFDSEALGELPEALARIAECVALSGHLLLDLAWALSGRSVDLPSEAQMLDSAHAVGLRLVDREMMDPAWVATEGSRHLELIRGRARELAIRYPEHSAAFEAYVMEQEAENRMWLELDMQAERARLDSNALRLLDLIGARKHDPIVVDG